MTESMIHIDDLIEKCGYFTNNTDINGGYGCTHVDCEEKEFIDEKKDKELGKCSVMNCPLGRESEKQDFIDIGEDPELMSLDEWIVPFFILKSKVEVSQSDDDKENKRISVDIEIKKELVTAEELVKNLTPLISKAIKDKK